MSHATLMIEVIMWQGGMDEVDGPLWRVEPR